MLKSTSINYQNLLVLFISISGCFSVLFGAWLAHASGHFEQSVIERLQSAHFYQVIHTLALLAMLLSSKLASNSVLRFSSYCFIFGILMFSGSLYLKTFLAWAAVGKLAPWGGTTLALGWLSLMLLTHRKWKL